MYEYKLSWAEYRELPTPLLKAMIEYANKRLEKK